MLGIVVFHESSSLFPSWLANLLMQPWNVAVFFVVAGYFMKWEQMVHPLTFVKHKLRTLYVPATVIYLLAVLLHNVFVYIGWYPLGEIHAGNGLPFSLYGWKEMTMGCMKALLCAGSGELVMGAMWFLYTLIYAMVGLSVIAWLISRLVRDAARQQWLIFTVLLVGAIASCVATQKLGLTLNRVNIAVTAMFLINLGRLWRQKVALDSRQPWMAAVCLLVFTQCFVLKHVGLGMAMNSFQDVGWLVLGTLAIIYCYTFIARSIEGSWFVWAVSLIGRESFYVMALHILGFFCCNSLLLALGIFDTESPKGMYTFVYGKDVLCFVLYTAFGIGVPLGIVTIKNSVQRVWARGMKRKK